MAEGHDEADMPFRVQRGSLLVDLRVTPNGGADRLEGVSSDASGRLFLRLRVSASPEKGKANAAVFKLLAKAWGLPKSSLELVSGETDRNKVVCVKGDVATLLPMMQHWLFQHLTQTQDNQKVEID